MKNFLKVLILISCYVLLSVTCEATTIGVTPIRFELSAKHARDVLTLSNQGNDPVIVEIKPYLWLVKNKKNSYFPTHDIFVSPPIAKIPPKQSQLIRLALLRSLSPDESAKYRIYIQEITPRDPKNKGIQVRLRLGVPIYVTP